MVMSLLPASAAAFAPRTAPTVVLNTRVEPWLTQTLKRVNRVKRPLNSTSQHFRCLTETLSGANAIWTLASLMLPKAPDAELRKDENLLIQALFNYQIIHIEAYVVHVDMVSQNEVAYKLTPETIDSLIDYHKEIYCVDIAAATYEWSDKDVQLKKLQDDFFQSINKFVFRTHVRALEGLEDEGAGELLEGRSDEVKTAIMGLFLPLLQPPPPPRVVDVVRMGSAMHSAMDNSWWSPASAMPLMSHLVAPVDPWRMLPSTPNPTNTAAESVASWSSCGAGGDTGSVNGSISGANETHLPSPAPSFSQPLFSSSPFYSSPPITASLLAAPLPSHFAQQCGPTAAMSGFGAFSFGFNDFMPQYATHI